MIIYLIATLFITIALTGILLRIYIPKFRSMNMGQPINEIGPRWHKSKEGTPTMGGLLFIVPIVLVVAAVSLIAPDKFDLSRLWITLTSSVLFGVIGIFDDLAKLRKRENEGLKAWQKFTLQLVVACLFVGVSAAKGCITTVMHIPFFDVDVDLGFFYYIISVILIVGIVNSVNLTDGVDGLSSSVTAVVCIFFIIVSSIYKSETTSLLACAVLGGCLGFLIYNAYPAKIIMGDTGSLFLGGAVVGLAFMYGSPLIILVCGIVYVFETLSVILQVLYFKITHGKRLFKMAPFHHHLEKCGYSERTIVIVAIAVSVVFSALAAFFM